ncbi:MAG: hypothetical protein M3430_14635 [Acidobacteriota bacterium]|nr:hypothetical protein [Acidobacteriota bacterium]
MTRMTRIALHYIAAACLAVAATGCAKTAPLEPPPPAAKRTPSPDSSEAVDRILEKYTAAVGGEEAIARVTSYKARGTFRMSIISEPGTFEVWAKDPDKSLTVVTFPRLGVIRKGRDGETRWTRTPFGGASDEGPNEFTGLERDADIYRAGKVKAMYESMKLEGMGRLGGRDVQIVEAKPARGPSEKMLFDKETGLLLRWDMVRKSAKRGNVFVKVHLEDYREAGGLKLPFTVRYAFESFSMTLVIEELQQNVEVDDAMFREPAGK